MDSQYEGKLNDKKRPLEFVDSLLRQRLDAIRYERRTTVSNDVLPTIATSRGDTTYRFLRTRRDVAD